MITPDTPFRGCTIGPVGFEKRLKMANPAVLAERPAREYYDAIRLTGVDPNFLLGMFFHESGGGKAGVATSTRSWGNTRDPWFGPYPDRLAVKGGSGYFSGYRNWFDGCMSTAARLVAPSWVYAARTTIRDIFDWPADQDLVWAPAGDFNNPASYLRSVIDDMNTYGTNEGQRPEVLKVPIITVPLLDGAANNPSLPLDLQYISVHETDNTDSGAGAQAHGRYLREGAVKVPASWHYTVDDEWIFKHFSTTPIPVRWHAADGSTGPGNRKSIAIETCVNKAKDSVAWQHALDNLTWLVARETIQGYVSFEHIVQHNHWKSTTYPTGKDCPAIIRERGLWPGLLVAFKTEIERQRGTQQELSHYFPETGRTMGGGFYAFWKMYGDLPIFGYPLTEEYTDAVTGLTMQYTERARFEHHPGAWPARFDVLLGRLGAETLERLGDKDAETKTRSTDPAPG